MKKATFSRRFCTQMVIIAAKMVSVLAADRSLRRDLAV